MEMHQIRYFLVLCEELSFTRAAQRCNVAQPSVTRAIRNLERELGGVLFRRKPRLELSDLGTAVWPFFQQIVRAAESARQAAIPLTVRDRNLTKSNGHVYPAPAFAADHRDP